MSKSVPSKRNLTSKPLKGFFSNNVKHYTNNNIMLETNLSYNSLMLLPNVLITNLSAFQVRF